MILSRFTFLQSSASRFRFQPLEPPIPRFPRKMVSASWFGPVLAYKLRLQIPISSCFNILQSSASRSQFQPPELPIRCFSKKNCFGAMILSRFSLLQSSVSRSQFLAVSTYSRARTAHTLISKNKCFGAMILSRFSLLHNMFVGRYLQLAKHSWWHRSG